MSVFFKMGVYFNDFGFYKEDYPVVIILLEPGSYCHDFGGVHIHVVINNKSLALALIVFQSIVSVILKQ